jgi:hypothetical protein
MTTRFGGVMGKMSVLVAYAELWPKDLQRTLLVTGGPAENTSCNRKICREHFL